MMIRIEIEQINSDVECFVIDDKDFYCSKDFITFFEENKKIVYVVKNIIRYSITKV